MKRWRAFLVVASVNSTLALVYYAVRTYLPNWVPDTKWFGPRAFTALLLAITAVGLWWAGRRYRRMAGEEPAVTATPGRTELYSLAGLTAFAALCTVLTAMFADWNTTLELPMREFTFIGVALAVATLYAGYRKLTRNTDTPNGAEPPLRLSLSGETVGLGALFLCGLCAVLLTGTRANAPAFIASTTAGDADIVIGPRLVEGSAVAVEAYELDEGEKSKHFGQVMSGLVMNDGRLYFGVSRAGLPGGAVACLNPATGQTHWFHTGSPKLKPVYCTPALADGKLYCGEGLHTDSDCRVYCLSAADGNPLWKEPFKTASHTEGTPAVLGGKVFFPAGDDGVYCADATSGARLWQFPGGKDRGIHIDAPPAVSNGTVFVGSGLYSFVAVALDANTGSEKWRADLKLRAFGPPLVRGDRVFYAVGTGNMGADTYHYDEEGDNREKTPAGAVVCFEAATGKERWRYDLPKSVHTGLAADAFTLYAGSRDGCVYAIDRESGKLRWKTAIGTAVTSCPAVATAGGYPVAVYAVSREGLVVCLNPQTGAVAWQKQLPGYAWNGQNDVISGPVVVSTPTPTGSRRTIYIGGSVMSESGLPVVTVFRFEDELGE
jgi:outer membrane protein assembly factor BamB